MHFAHRLIAGILACSMVLQPLRADDLPELGDAASNELSLGMEKKIGRQIMNEIRWREPAYLDDSDVEAYLNQLGGRLTAASKDPGMGFVFFPINDPSINAFAMPGGYIGVHSGLIIAAQAESELAGVMAHEISHVTQRHIARQVFQSKQMSMAAMLAMGLALLAARSSPQVAGAAIATTQAGAVSAQLAFSRDFEREADRLGFDVLRQAGFDVRGMVGFFTRLQQSVRLYENNATAYLRSHPLTGERLTDMQNREQSLPYRQVPDSVDFQLVRAKLRAMQGTAAEARRDFETQLQEKKFTSEAATRYGLAYALYRGRDWVGAEREIEAVRRLRISSPIPERLLADTRIAQGDANGGLRVYRDAMVRFPLNQGLLYGYGSALIGAGYFDEALRFVEAQLQSYPEDLRFHKMRAESNAGLGRRAQQHQALAEVFALQGQTANAVHQLELAQKAGDANFYEMSAIDARLRELKLRQLEELKEKRN
jgi:predicted Zn-dependent protease